METPRLAVQRLEDDSSLPRYAHPGDAGLDLCSAEHAVIAPGERRVVRTGIAVAIPDGFAGLVTPRSGTAVSAGLSMVNTPGVVDAGYRGEIKLVLINLDASHEIVISAGDRVAQMLLVPVASAEVVEVDALPPSARGTGGFGSTGR